jgi:hypothetical protein
LEKKGCTALGSPKVMADCTSARAIREAIDYLMTQDGGVVKYFGRGFEVRGLRWVL